MSTHDAATTHAGSDHEDAEHDAHHEDAAPLPEEPVTPSWLPLLGVGLFLLAILGFVLNQGSSPTAGSPTQAAEAAQKAR